jgi:hypothetical protein
MLLERPSGVSLHADGHLCCCQGNVNKAQLATKIPDCNTMGPSAVSSNCRTAIARTRMDSKSAPV